MKMEEFSVFFMLIFGFVRLSKGYKSAARLEVKGTVVDKLKAINGKSTNVLNIVFITDNKKF